MLVMRFFNLYDFVLLTQQSLRLFFFLLLLLFALGLGRFLLLLDLFYLLQLLDLRSTRQNTV